MALIVFFRAACHHTQLLPQCRLAEVCCITVNLINSLLPSSRTDSVHASMLHACHDMQGGETKGEWVKSRLKGAFGPY